MKILLSIFITMLNLALFGQNNLELKKNYFSIQQRSLPNNPLDSNYHTYNVQVSASNLIEPFLKEFAPQNALKIEGWKKMDNNGHITIEINFEDLVTESISIKERIEQSQNSIDNKSSKKTFFYEQMISQLNIKVRLFDYKGNIIKVERLVSKKIECNSPEFPFKTLAEGYFKMNQLRATNTSIKAGLFELIQTLSEQLSENFGYKEVLKNDFLWTINNKQDAEFDFCNKAFLHFNNIIFTTNSNTPIESIKNNLQPIINYFETLKTKYTSSTVHDKRLRFISYYNLATIYNYLDDPYLMLKEAMALQTNNYKNSEAKKIIENALQLKTDLQKSKYKSRHFVLNTAAYKGPLENEVTKNKLN